MACSGAFGTPGWVRTSGLSLRRRPLYPTELRGLIQKLFNFRVQQDSNELPLRRRPLYPTELRGLIQKIFNFEGLQDSKDSISRKAPLLPSFKCPGPSLCEEQRYYSILCWKEQRQFCLWPVRSPATQSTPSRVCAPGRACGCTVCRWRFSAAQRPGSAPGYRWRPDPGPSSSRPASLADGCRLPWRPWIPHPRS